MATENLSKKSVSIPPAVKRGEGAGEPWGFGRQVRVLGIDLAWGDRNPDGLCALAVNGRKARLIYSGLSRGDEPLLDWVRGQAGDGPVLLALDAPVVVPNVVGMRLVDRLAHVHFGRYKCGCYPANQELCARPCRLVRKLEALGFQPGWLGPRSLAEVYPHPAMVRWFKLPERIPYKKGRVAEKRHHFGRLQSLLKAWLSREVPGLECSEELNSLLDQPWSKGSEDRTDALFCALIGYWHLMYRGRRSQILGDAAGGFLLLPQSP